jgi:hypothetical protein
VYIYLHKMRRNVAKTGCDVAKLLCVVAELRCGVAEWSVVSTPAWLKIGPWFSSRHGTLEGLFNDLLQIRVRHSFSLKAKISENKAFFRFEKREKNLVFFALFACK